MVPHAFVWFRKSANPHGSAWSRMALHGSAWLHNSSLNIETNKRRAPNHHKFAPTLPQNRASGNPDSRPLSPVPNTTETQMGIALCATVVYAPNYFANLGSSTDREAVLHKIVSLQWLCHQLSRSQSRFQIDKIAWTR